VNAPFSKNDLTELMIIVIYSTLIQKMLLILKIFVNNIDIDAG